MKEDIWREIVLVDGVTAKLDGIMLKVKGPEGEVERSFLHPKINLSVKDKKIVLGANKATKREKTIIGSYEAHIKNMIKGVRDFFVYKLKVCSGHFPMNVSVSGAEVIIKNFLGESVPRRVKLLENVEVKVSGTEIVVTSANKETAGQMAARIENLCRIANKDLRIFQDGCYIINKAGKML